MINWKAHRALYLLLILFAAIATLYTETIPPFEGPDEGEHFAYVSKLIWEREFPDPEKDLQTTYIKQAVAQAPYYYMKAAWFTGLRSFPRWEVDPIRNPWGAYPAPVTSRDNRNQYLMQPNQHTMDANQQVMTRALMWMRRMSIFYGWLAIIGVYWGALAIWQGDRQWATFAALVYAFNPLLIQTFAQVSNDVTVIAFGTLTVGCSLNLYQQWRKLWLLVLAGILIGLAALSKTSGLAFWAIPCLAILLGWWRDRVPVQKLITAGTIVIGVAVLISGWWYVRGWRLYDDPLGTKPHAAMEWHFDEPQSLGQIISRLDIIVVSSWANFGSGEVRPDTWGYVLPLFLLILSLVGWGIVLIRQYFPPPPLQREGLFHPSLGAQRVGEGQGMGGISRDHLLILLATVLLGTAALFQWMSMFDLITARLFYPFYGALILLLLGGLRVYRGWRHWFAGALGGMALIMIPTVIVYAFSKPALLDTPPADLNMVDLQVADGARLVGYKVDSPVIEQGDPRQFTLCWSAEPGGEKIAMPNPFALHIVAPDNTIVGRRESYLGMGTYTLWEPGKTFCDEFALPITGDLEPMQVYPIALSFFDVDTQQTIPINGQNTVFIGSLHTPAPPVSAESLADAAFRFEGVSLLDYDLRVENDHLILDMAWGTYAAPGRPFKLFIHVLDAAGEQVAQLDPVPGGARYPIDVWGAGEYVTDTITLPLTALLSGEYQIRVGLYDPATFARVRVTDVAGNEQPDQAALLGTISIQ